MNREDNCNKDQRKENKHKESPIPVILEKFMKNEYSPELQFRFAQWLDENKHQDEVLEYLRREFDAIPLSVQQNEDDEMMSERRLLKLKIAINQIAQENIFPEVNESKKEQIKSHPQRSSISLWMLRIAAVLIPIMIVLSVYLLIETDNEAFNQNISQKEIVAPKGTQKEDILPEGSKVWLNAGTKITYTDDLQNKQRKARLRGEAYFSVTKDKEKPFIVETDYLTVKVVGTQFNVKAYPEEDKMVVTLDEGKVEIKTKDGAVYVLEPNQQLVFDNKTGGATILVTERDENSPGWKTGQLVFDDLTFQEILYALERHYNLTIEVDSAVFTNKQYSVKFVQNENITDAMKIIQKMVQGFSYEISENKLVIKK